MLHAFAPHLGGLAPLPPGEQIARARWVDLYRPLDAQVRQVKALGIDVPTLEDMEEIEISNRLYREGDAIYMTAVLPGELPDGKPVAMPVTFILSPDRLVTVRHHAPRPFTTFPTRAERSASGVSGPDRIFLGLMEEIVARLADILEGVGRVLDQTGALVFDSNANARDAELRAEIERLQEILGSDEVLRRLVSDELAAVAAEHGADKVLETVRGVLASEGLEPAYLEIRDLALREAPERGDARLLAAVDLDGVRLIDNVGLPLGIGFKHIEEDR